MKCVLGWVKEGRCEGVWDCDHVVKELMKLLLSDVEREKWKKARGKRNGCSSTTHSGLASRFLCSYIICITCL